MADQGKWFKLWCASLTDSSLVNLPNEDWARWAKLGTYIKQHGTDGKLVVEAPALMLQHLFQVTSFEAISAVLKRLPNCKLGERKVTVSGETNTRVSLDIEFLNWHKYQDDLSSNRVRNFRAKKRQRETIQEEKRSRREVEERLSPKSPFKQVQETATPPVLVPLQLFAADATLCQKWSVLATHWTHAYPGVDIFLEVRSAHSWLLEHPEKNRTNHMRFLGSWFRKAYQIRSGGKPYARSPA